METPCRSVLRTVELFSEPQLQIPIVDTTVDFVHTAPNQSIECSDNLSGPFSTVPTISQASAPEHQSSTPVRRYPIRNLKPAVNVNLRFWGIIIPLLILKEQKKARMCITLFILIPQFSHKLFDSSHLNVSVNVSELIDLKL